MYKKAWYTCKIVVLVIKPIAFVEFPLPSPSSSSDLKVPIKVPMNLFTFQAPFEDVTWATSMPPSTYSETPWALAPGPVSRIYLGVLQNFTERSKRILSPIAKPVWQMSGFKRQSWVEIVVESQVVLNNRKPMFKRVAFPLITNGGLPTIWFFTMDKKYQ